MSTQNNYDIVETFAMKEFYRQIYSSDLLSDLEFIDNIRRSEDEKSLSVTVSKTDSPAKRYFKVTLNIEEEPF